MGTFALFFPSAPRLSRTVFLTSRFCGQGTRIEEIRFSLYRRCTAPRSIRR